jgi:hypothetical protein
MQKLHLRKKENVCMFICKEYAKVRIFYVHRIFFGDIVEYEHFEYGWMDEHFEYGWMDG